MGEKIRRTLTRYLFELIVIVTGILLSMSFNARIVRHTRRVQAIHELAAVRVEMEMNQAELTGYSKNLSEIIPIVDQWKKAMDEQLALRHILPNGYSEKFDATLPSDLPRAFRARFLSLGSASWKLALGTEAIHSVRFEILAPITNTYLLQEDTEDRSKALFEELSAFPNVPIYYRTDFELLTFIARVKNLSVHLRFLQELTNSLLGQYDETIEMLRRIQYRPSTLAKIVDRFQSEDLTN